MDGAGKQIIIIIAASVPKDLGFEIKQQLPDRAVARLTKKSNKKSKTSKSLEILQGSTPAL